MSEKLTFYVQSLLAGVLIGCGDIVYVVCENKIVGSFLFSLGLISILVKGYPPIHRTYRLRRGNQGFL